jgi:hypothetical protein
VWRQVAVNRPPYGCAKAEGKSAFCFLKTYFGSGLAHQAGKKVVLARFLGRRRTESIFNFYLRGKRRIPCLQDHGPRTGDLRRVELSFLILFANSIPLNVTEERKILIGWRGRRHATSMDSDHLHRGLEDALSVSEAPGEAALESHRVLLFSLHQRRRREPDSPTGRVVGQVEALSLSNSTLIEIGL